MKGKWIPWVVIFLVCLKAVVVLFATFMLFYLWWTY